MQGLIDAVIQVIFFTLISLVLWFIFVRKNIKFTSWIGVNFVEKINLSESIKMSLVILIFGLATGFIVDKVIVPINGSNGNSSTFPSLFSIFVFSFIQTSLSEEILFRGALLSLFKNFTNINIANGIQAFIFGLLHSVPLYFLGYKDPFSLFVITIYPTILGYLLGLLRIKYSNGSILPSYLVHGLLNLISRIGII